MNQNIVRKLLNKAGFDIVRFPYPNLKSRATLIRHFQIDTLLDVGANVGQYALQMRRIGYNGRIFSFEPLSREYAILRDVSKFDQLWQTYNMALGDVDTSMPIGITENSESSSLVALDQNAESKDSSLETIRTEEVTVKRLDTVFPILNIADSSHIYLKLDVQGFEKNVLDGAFNTLNIIKGIQIELRLESIYENTMLYDEMKALLESKGFRLFGLEPGYANPVTGKLIEIDGIFFRD